MKEVDKTKRPGIFSPVDYEYCKWWTNEFFGSIREYLLHLGYKQGSDSYETMKAILLENLRWTGA